MPKLPPDEYPGLIAAIARAAALHKQMEADRNIAPTNQLTATELALLIDAAKRGAQVVGIRYIDFASPLPPDLFDPA